MKTEKVEQLLLLEQSGELNFIQRWQLDRALASQPELKNYRDELREITSLTRASGPAGELPPDVLGAIRQAAAEQSLTGFSSVDSRWLKHAIAMTAMFVIVCGIAAVNQFRPHASGHKSLWNDGIDAEISRVNNQITTSLETASESVPDANAIARELLLLEGSEQ